MMFHVLNYAIVYLHVLEKLFFLIRKKQKFVNPNSNLINFNPIMIITKFQREMFSLAFYRAVKCLKVLSLRL